MQFKFKLMEFPLKKRRIKVIKNIIALLVVSLLSTFANAKDQVSSLKRSEGEQVFAAKSLAGKYFADDEGDEGDSGDDSGDSEPAPGDYGDGE